MHSNCAQVWLSSSWHSHFHWLSLQQQRRQQQQQQLLCQMECNNALSMPHIAYWLDATYSFTAQPKI
jgi:hypothetical protein